MLSTFLQTHATTESVTMEILEEYGPTVAATALGALLGVAGLGLLLYWGKESDVDFAEKIRDGLGG